MEGGKLLCILGSLILETVAIASLAVTLMLYFNGIMHYKLADAANMHTNYLGTSYIFSIVVAVLADTIIGRYKSVALALLTVQANSASLKPPICTVFVKNADCEKPSGNQEAFLYISLFLLALGSVGFKASLPSHGADQFDEKDPKEARQLSTYFNGLLLALCIGGPISLIFNVWIQFHKGWAWGFGVSTIEMVLGTLIFAFALPLYRIHDAQRTNPTIEIIQVFVAAIHNRKLPLPADPTELYEIGQDTEAVEKTEYLPHRDIYRFLDKAAIRTKSDVQPDKQETPNPWKLSRVTQVENAKIILDVLPIFSCSIIVTLCLAQLQTFSIRQGHTMDTRITKSFKIPPPSIPIIPFAFLIILIPFYDAICVPLLLKFTGIPTGITHLQRIGVGLILCHLHGNCSNDRGQKKRSC